MSVFLRLLPVCGSGIGSQYTSVAPFCLSNSIAIVSFGLSLWNFIETRLNNRVNLSVECKDFIIAEHFSRQPLYIALSLINKSQLPISISRAFITIDNETFEFSWIPQVVHQARLGTKYETFDRTIVKSITLPLSLAGLGTVGGYFYVETFGRVKEEKIKNTNAVIVLHTNRGVKQYSVALSTIAIEI